MVWAWCLSGHQGDSSQFPGELTVAGGGILLVDKAIYPAGKTTCPEEEDKLILWGPVTFDGL